VGVQVVLAGVDDAPPIVVSDVVENLRAVE
jgi:hypothetical protein